MVLFALAKKLIYKIALVAIKLVIDFQLRFTPFAL